MVKQTSQHCFMEILMKMKAIVPLLLSISLSAPLAVCAQSGVSAWITNPDRSELLKLQSPPLPFTTAAATHQVIDIDPAKTYQTMDGFGFALTEGSAQLIMHMDPAKRAALLQELFTDTGSNIGVSYLRLSIGASDMNASVYSYDDLPEGQTDPSLAHFTLAHDQVALIPLLKEILAIDPKIDILGSPWSAPLWMKTNGRAQGGVLKPADFPVYAQYFVKYIEGMKAEGITIDAVTIQNEPLNEKNTPSMLMLAPEQADFIANDLGPAFQKAGIQTKIILYDHNLDHPLYPLSILRDPAAAKYVDGTGFHLYGGSVDAMTEVHDAFPNKNIYFTEQSITQRDNADPINISSPVAQVIIGVSRNWSKNILLWNLAADPANGPHTNNGGCSGCSGAITIDGNNVTRNVAYYTLAHASKFVPPGSIRIGSNALETLSNVAFKTPDGKQVLIVSNTSGSTQRFDVHSGSKSFSAKLDDGCVGTYVW
jgi:glucosylceramidase